MLDQFVFIGVMVLTVLSSVWIFLSKRMLNAVLALTVVFIGSSLFFLLLGQTLVAMLQLFVFVGGLSTYMVVAVAADESVRTPPNAIMLGVLAVEFSISFIEMITIGGTAVVISPSYNNVFSTFSQAAFENYYPVFYAIAFMLFAGTVGSVLVIKKFITLIV